MAEAEVRAGIVIELTEEEKQRISVGIPGIQKIGTRLEVVEEDGRQTRQRELFVHLSHIDADKLDAGLSSLNARLGNIMGLHNIRIFKEEELT